MTPSGTAGKDGSVVEARLAESQAGDHRLPTTPEREQKSTALLMEQGIGLLSPPWVSPPADPSLLQEF